ncbi:hypothetical protein P1J78_10030 [Psychromarinibacter sp. C21-152]|uniref:Uncharacterized protein n=1 Tax=Psychromarinibacter sediminicola TaxID=3033385 RepID=A0AAE3NN80_9RHOB|nr:hypothetical protein [Psychromarinibacter sediminicola]MDF0601068.1 hypothetical protein [Psychromarinibacter sediminicola]
MTATRTSPRPTWEERRRNPHRAEPPAPRLVAAPKARPGRRRFRLFRRREVADPRNL